MGRRALRKIDPALDLSRRLFALDAVPRPVDAAWLGRRAPLEVEAGSGKGLFLSAAAMQRPEHEFLGIEIRPKYARFAAARLAKQQIKNARIVCGDAQRLVREHLADSSAAAVHVYFPDPWWKARHKKRRLLNELFLRDVERVLQPGGSLHFWTDVEEYFQATLALIREVTKLAGPLSVAESAPQHDLDYRTHFERRTRLAGERVYRAEFRKGEPRQDSPGRGRIVSPS
ncbi:MAG: tRNA (guanosine(46)-N7)-methyltransferase TrmB [Planctomycetia bacterium]|nr:tRNA (guanosine(46)-N7)-methyltransferase TrmB [Planctomycetia bacterium]